MLIPLKELRQAHGLTQSELGKKLNIAPSTVGMWEKGYRSPDYEMLKNIADYFDVTTDYLLGRKVGTPTLSKQQTKLLDMFDGLNLDGQNTLMNVLGSLRLSHAKNRQKDFSIIHTGDTGSNYGVVGGDFNSGTMVK